MSQRANLWLVATLAGGLAWLGRLGGLFRGLDAWLLAKLHLPLGHGVLPLWVELICALLFAFGTAIVGLQVASAKSRTGLLLATVLQPVSAVAVGALAGVWISPFTWLVAILTAWLGAAAYQFSSAGKRERLLREIFGKNLSESALAGLLKQPYAIHSKTAQATIVSARYLGEEWGHIEEISQRLREQSAWVEVQAGNRLLAVWNLPVETQDAAEKAVAATLEMKENWQVGIATGEVVGEIPESTAQWQMRGLGFEKADALCQANTTFGSHVLVDLATSDLVREAIVLRPVDFLTLPTMDLGVEVFEPLVLSISASPEAVSQRDRFWEAVIYFRQKRFPEALAAFQKSGDDAVVHYYLKRLEKLTSTY